MWVHVFQTKSNIIVYSCYGDNASAGAFFHVQDVLRNYQCFPLKHHGAINQSILNLLYVYICSHGLPMDQPTFSWTNRLWESLGCSVWRFVDPMVLEKVYKWHDGTLENIKFTTCDILASCFLKNFEDRCPGAPRMYCNKRAASKGGENEAAEVNVDIRFALEVYSDASGLSCEKYLFSLPPGLAACHRVVCCCNSVNSDLVCPGCFFMEHVHSTNLPFSHPKC